MNALILDPVDPTLISGLEALGIGCTIDDKSSKEQIQETLYRYDGVVVRSRMKIDKSFIDAGHRLQFIARVGAGLETIDTDYACSKGITLISAPEGNRQAVGEQAVGMLLMLMNNLCRADREVRQGLWRREANRGHEIAGKTVGIIGYGNMGGAFARCLSGFGCRVIAYDIKSHYGDKYAEAVPLDVLFSQADIVSIHTPLTDRTRGMVDYNFFKSFSKPIYFINTARGPITVTADLIRALDENLVIGACLDVLEYEKSSFASLFEDKSSMPEAFARLIESDRVVLSPHIAGWTFESNVKMAETIVRKIRERFYK